MSRSELLLGEPYEIVVGVANRYNITNLQFKNSSANQVGIGDERLVIKAPQSTQSMGSLAVEAVALNLLEHSRTLSAAVPSYD